MGEDIEGIKQMYEKILLNKDLEFVSIRDDVAEAIKKMLISYRNICSMVLDFLTRGGSDKEREELINMMKQLIPKFDELINSIPDTFES